MEPARPRLLTVNGGSSSIKAALFEAGASLRRILEGAIQRIGLSGDLDRGLIGYLARKEGMSAQRFNEMVNVPAIHPQARPGHAGSQELEVERSTMNAQDLVDTASALVAGAIS